MFTLAACPPLHGSVRPRTDYAAASGRLLGTRRWPDTGPLGEPPAVTLVVCTRDRAPMLATCLDALGALRPAMPWELVLVDNGSADATPRVLAEFAEHLAARVTVVTEPRPGLAAARNAGVRAARAPLVVFTDDDCYPAPDHLDRWAAVFADPGVDFGGGRIVLHDPEDYPISIWLDEHPTPLPPGAYVPPGLVQGANMAFRRDVLYAIGGFDPALGPGGAFNFEDLDAASRATHAGYAGGFFPGPTVRHHHRRRAAAAAALMRSYDHGRGAYFASLLLRGQALGVLARHVRWALRDAAPGVPARELAGARQYVAHRLRRRPERPLAGGRPRA